PIIKGNAEPGTQVLLFANGSQIGSGFINGSGQYTLQPGQPLGDGTYTITVQLGDTAGNLSAVSPAMQPSLTISTSQPSKPTISLDPGSDSGTLGDNVTAFNPLVFNGKADPGTKLTVFDNGVAVQTFVVGSSGTFKITLNLSDGPHDIF